jgi:hypothetical protein
MAKCTIAAPDSISPCPTNHQGNISGCFKRHSCHVQLITRAAGTHATQSSPHFHAPHTSLCHRVSRIICHCADISLPAQLAPDQDVLGLPVWSLSLVSRFGVSAWFLCLVSQLGLSVWSLSLILQFGLPVWSDPEIVCGESLQLRKVKDIVRVLYRLRTSLAASCLRDFGTLQGRHAPRDIAHYAAVISR